MRLPQSPQKHIAIHLRHSKVGQQHIYSQVRNKLKCFRGGRRGPNYSHVRLMKEHHLQSLPHDVMVVHDEDANLYFFLVRHDAMLEIALRNGKLRMQATTELVESY